MFYFILCLLLSASGVWSLSSITRGARIRNVNLCTCFIILSWFWSYWGNCIYMDAQLFMSMFIWSQQDPGFWSRVCSCASNDQHLGLIEAAAPSLFYHLWPSSSVTLALFISSLTTLREASWLMWRVLFAFLHFLLVLRSFRLRSFVMAKLFLFLLKSSVIHFKGLLMWFPGGDVSYAAILGDAWVEILNNLTFIGPRLQLTETIDGLIVRLLILQHFPDNFHCNRQ